MAYEIPGFSYTLEASADLSTNQYCAISVDANGRAVIATTALNIDGVLQDKPEALGIVGTIMQKGITKGKVGAGGVTAGDLLQVGVGGAFILRAAGITVGRALESGAAGTIIPVLLY